MKKYLISLFGPVILVFRGHVKQAVLSTAILLISISIPVFNGNPKAIVLSILIYFLFNTPYTYYALGINTGFFNELTKAIFTVLMTLMCGFCIYGILELNNFFTFNSVNEIHFYMILFIINFAITAYSGD